MARRKSSDVFDEVADEFNDEHQQAETETEEVEQEQSDTKKSRRRGGSSNEIADDEETVKVQGETAEERKLTEELGPIDDTIDSIGEVELVDLYPADSSIMFEDKNGKKRPAWLILEFEYKKDFGPFGGQTGEDKPLVGRININVSKGERVGQGKNAETVYTFDEVLKEKQDKRLAFAFGKYGVTDFEDLDIVDKLLDETEDNGEKVTFEAFEGVFKRQVSNGDSYSAFFALTNRHKSGNFIETEFVGIDLFKEAVRNGDDKNNLSVKVISVSDNCSVYKRENEKTGKIEVFPFGQIEVYVQYGEKNYMLKYKYLKTTDKDGNDIPNESRTPDFQKKFARINEIADKLGIKGSNLALELSKVKDLDAKIHVSESNVQYQNGQHKGETVYYAKLA